MILSSETNAVSRLFNSTINKPQTPFQPIQTRQNVAAPNAPPNGEALASLSRKKYLFLCLRRSFIDVH